MGRILAMVGGAVLLAAVGAGAMWYLTGRNQLADAARGDVAAIGEAITARYTAGGDPVVAYAEGIYSVDTIDIGATITDPTLAYYPGNGSFCVVLTTVEGGVYGYSATDGPVNGSCAPAGVEPVGPGTVDTLDTSLTTSEYWFGLSTGDCVLEPTLTASDSTNASPGPLLPPTVVPCTEAHAGEVYAIARISATQAPDATAFRNDTRTLCEGPAFEAYVGVPYLSSNLYYSVLFPSDATWAIGANEMVCLLTAEDGTTTTTGSYKGSSG